MKIVESNQINQERLKIIIMANIKDNFKQYESMSIILEKVLSFIYELHGGLIQLSNIMNPNTKYDHE